MGNLRRFAKKRDANEPAIIRVLEAMGWHVERISARGVPDLLMSRSGEWRLAEVKMPGEALTPDQEAFRQRAKAPVPTFTSRDDVFEWERQRQERKL